MPVRPCFFLPLSRRRRDVLPDSARAHELNSTIQHGSQHAHRLDADPTKVVALCLEPIIIIGRPARFLDTLIHYSGAHGSRPASPDKVPNLTPGTKYWSFLAAGTPVLVKLQCLAAVDYLWFLTDGTFTGMLKSALRIAQ
jgi:hypothetical protein